MGEIPRICFGHYNYKAVRLLCTSCSYKKDCCDFKNWQTEQEAKETEQQHKKYYQD